MQKRRNEKPVEPKTPARALPGEEEDAFELLRKFGTYEVQPTADTENAFPAISQGLPDAEQDESP